MIKKEWCLFVIFCVAVVQTLKAIPTRSKIEYANPELVINATSSVRRSGRGANYHFNLSAQLLKLLDNHFQILLQFYEVLSGKYVLLPARITHKFCDFFAKDALLGKFIVTQFPKNLTDCPYQPGYYTIQNLTYEKDFPFEMPFTFQRLENIVCLDFQILKDSEKQFHLTVHLKLIQKPRNGKV